MEKKPNYSDYGLSGPMSLNLRRLVENQLLQDLNYYDVDTSNLRFDWSESCIEGHLSQYLDSSLENYSGITVHDSENNMIAEGWMDYVNENEYKINGTYFISFWDFVTIWKNNQIAFEKKEPGIPRHIFDNLPEELRKHYS